MTLRLGCIADDYTGASDLANTLTRQGLRTVQTIGVPADDLKMPEVDAVVVSLKSRSIEASEAIAKSLAAEKWLINPSHGDCNDYAVSKRSELLARGWPTRALLLSEVVTAWGEHHLVLVVRSSAGDLVLDNLTTQIRPWSREPSYRLAGASG